MLYLDGSAQMGSVACLPAGEMEHEACTLPYLVCKGLCEIMLAESMPACVHSSWQ